MQQKNGETPLTSSSYISFRRLRKLKQTRCCISFLISIFWFLLNEANVEVTLRIVYQPQAIFRIRPVNRCSATIAGMYTLDYVHFIVFFFHYNFRTLLFDMFSYCWDYNGNIIGQTNPLHPCFICHWQHQYQPQLCRFWAFLYHCEWCNLSSAGHTEAVLAVSFSPDGRCLASGSGDTTVRFWDLSTQTPLFTCKGES